MRNAFISTFIVLALSLAVCFVSIRIHESALAPLNAVCLSAMEHVRNDDENGALAAVEQMYAMMDKNCATLELFASHNDLHDTISCIAEAQVALECGDMDDACQALTRLTGLIEHLRGHERFSPGNLL